MDTCEAPEGAERSNRNQPATETRTLHIEGTQSSETAAKSIFLSMTRGIGKRDLKQRGWVKCLEIEMESLGV